MKKNLSIIFLYLLSLNVFSALPPLTEEERNIISTHKFEGQVQSVSFELSGEENLDMENYVDRNYSAIVHVSKVIKGEGISVGQNLVIKFWTPDSRPSDWCGDNGQNRIMREGEQVRIFCTESGQEYYDLLNPNGYDVLQNN